MCAREYMYKVCNYRLAFNYLRDQHYGELNLDAKHSKTVISSDWSFFTKRKCMYVWMATSLFSRLLLRRVFLWTLKNRKESYDVLWRIHVYEKQASSTQLLHRTLRVGMNPGAKHRVTILILITTVVCLSRQNQETFSLFFHQSHGLNLYSNYNLDRPAFEQHYSIRILN